MPFDLPCILFAGGKSSRMGQNKALLPFGGYSSLAQFQYDRLSKLFTHVYIATKTADKFDFTADFILDPENADFAPTAGFVAAFECLKSDRIFALSVDTPFVDATIIQTLLDADAPLYDAVISKTASGIHPMAGIYHRSLLSELTRMLNEDDHRLGKLLGNSKTHYVQFDNEELFANLNHPNEYEEAVSRYNSENQSK